MISSNIILIFVIQVLSTFFSGIFALNADDAMLLKFHQSVYKIRNQRAEVISIDKKYFNLLEITTFKFNRTTPALNITVSSKYDVKDEVDVVLQSYKRASNEYRLFPMRFRFNLCKYSKNNIFGLQNALKCGNVSSCVMKKNTVYHVCNFMLDDTKLPPLIPTGEFKSELTLLYEEQEVAVVAGYAEIYYPMKIP